MDKFRPRRLSFVALVSAVTLAIGAGHPVAAQAADEPSDDMTTVAVVAAARYDKLIGDVGFLGSLGGNPQAGQMIEGAISFFTQGKGLEAIDKTQPWGVIVQTDGEEFIPIGCLPVTKPEDLLAVATAYGAQVIEGENGVKEVLLQNQQSIFVKQQAGWAFLSTAPESLARLPKDPAATLSTLAAEYILAASVSVNEVPEMYRQFALQAMQAGMQQQLAQQADESDEQYKTRRKMAEAELERWSRMLNDTDSITVGWAIDAQQQRTYMDFTQTFVPDSKMAQQVAAYGQPRTNFAGFFQPDAAATMTFVTKADPKLIEEDIQYFESMMRTTREQINKAIDDLDELADRDEARESLKAAASDFIDAFEATVRAGQMDGGASLHLSPESLTLVAGTLVKEPTKVESGLKKLESAAQKAPEFPGIEWNAARHFDVNFHTLTVPVPADQKGPRQLLGEELSIAIGIGPQAIYLAVGRDNLTAIKQAIDASTAEPEKAVPPFELAISLGPIMEVAAAQAEEGQQKAIAQSMADMLRNEAAGRDHIRAVGQLIPNGLRYRFEAEEGVLRAIGKGATEAQRRALQANQ